MDWLLDFTRHQLLITEPISGSDSLRGVPSG